MKYTLLEMVQLILSSMDSDEVNSSFDTTESTQVTYIVRSTYFDILNRANLPEHNTIFTLTSSGDNTKPTIMYVPNTVSRIDWVKYNCIESGDTAAVYKTIDFVPVSEFMNEVLGYDTDETTIDSFTHTMDSSTATFHYKNDAAPTIYTSIDDYTLVFNSYDSAVDTTLQQSKTMCFGHKIPTFDLSDETIPDLDEEQFPLLLNEAKALAWAELKQTPHNKAEINSRRGWVNLQKSKTRSQKLSDFDSLPYFGRK